MTAAVLIYFIFQYLPAVSLSAGKCILRTLDHAEDGRPWMSILSFVKERLQGLQYLVQGPSALRLGYTRV